MLIIDFHTHYYPSAYLDGMRSTNSDVRVETDAWGRTMILIRGFPYGPITDPMSRPGPRLEDMAAHGIDLQVLTISVPGVDFLSEMDQISVSRTVNDELAQICRDHPQQFAALACLPLKDAEAGANELERSVRELGLHGGEMFTNLEGQRIDEPHFWPVYERAEALDVPIFIHPASPIGRDELIPYRLGAMLGFMDEINVTIARLVYRGVLERFPRLKLVFTHLGGSFPYLYHRIARFDREPDCRVHIKEPAAASLKKLYIDSAANFLPALQCAHAVVGAGHLLFGSDYPFPGGHLPSALASLDDSPLSDAEKELIRSGNARALLKL